MGRKEKTTLYIDRDVKRKAQEHGLNLSKVCENALKAASASVSRAIKEGFERGRQATQAPAREAETYRPVKPVAGVQIPTPALMFPAMATTAGLRLPANTHPGLMTKFKRVLKVDLQLKKLTVNGYAQGAARFMAWLGDKLVTRDTLRDYLDTYKDAEASTYNNQLKSLKVFCRDYLGRPDLVATFKFRPVPFKPPTIPPKKQLQQFFWALRDLDLRVACYFMLYATSAWRRREVMALHREDVDLKRRMMTHRLKASATKGRLPGFFNAETKDILGKYLATRTDHNPKLLPISERTFRAIWQQAAAACGFMIQPQMLRDWFCEEMGNLDVPDRYIDAFCGRVPKKVLAKHYTDYAPQKLKRIYDKAGLKVLS